MENYRAFVNGEFIESHTKSTISSHNPYTQSTWASIPEMDDKDVNNAIISANEAFKKWKAEYNGLDRSQLLINLANLMEENADQLALIDSTDNGKIIRETKNQVLFAARNYRYFAGYADKLLGDSVPLDNMDFLDYTVLEPLGVVGLITAWNSPLSLLANKLAPALATGNTVVIKPSELASASTLEFAKLINEAGFPPGVVNIVTGGANTGDALIRHPKIRKVSFTGGVETAKKIYSAVSENLIPVTLELGGKSPNIIFEDADIDEAVNGAIAGIFGAAGQTCIAGSRLLVEENIIDQVVEKLIEKVRKIKIGNPLDTDTDFGPLANKNQYNKILEIINQASSSDAKLLYGGKAIDTSEGYFVEPTIFQTEDLSSYIVKEEIFGPVLTIIPFETLGDAVEIANNSIYGLAAGIWTKNIIKAHKIASQLEAGNVWINTYRASAVGTPFGGRKLSGFGRERSWHSLYEYTQTKNVMINLSETPRDPFLMQTK